MRIVFNIYALKIASKGYEMERKIGALQLGSYRRTCDVILGTFLSVLR